MTTETTVYTRPDGTAYSEADCAVIERVKSDLLTGATLARHAASARSVYGYHPPMDRWMWSHMMGTLAQMAARDDELAQIAAAIAGRINLYGTPAEADAQMYEAAFKAVHAGYDDVLGRAAPDAGRWSDHQHKFALHTLVMLAYWLAEAGAKVQYSVPGVGWCVDAIARAERIRINPAQFPSLRV